MVRSRAVLDMAGGIPRPGRLVAGEELVNERWTWAEEGSLPVDTVTRRGVHR
jgi:hypothetical protein